MTRTFDVSGKFAHSGSVLGLWLGGWSLLEFEFVVGTAESAPIDDDGLRVDCDEDWVAVSRCSSEGEVSCLSSFLLGWSPGNFSRILDISGGHKRPPGHASFNLLETSSSVPRNMPRATRTYMERRDSIFATASMFYRRLGKGEYPKRTRCSFREDTPRDKRVGDNSYSMPFKSRRCGRRCGYRYRSRCEAQECCCSQTNEANNRGTSENKCRAPLELEQS